MNNWYDDIDVATLQRIKTYSAFCDYKSQNLMLQTLYEAMQKKIDEYKKTNKEIAKDFAALRKQVPQWHDLRKNPTDVPKENVTVLLLTEVESLTARYYNEYEAFFRLNNKLDYCVFIAPMSYIAWCELPKYTEE